MIETKRLEDMYETLKNQSVMLIAQRLQTELQLAQIQRQDRIIELLEAMEEWLPTRD